MLDGPTAAVIVSAVLTLGGSIVVAVIKLVPSRHSTLEPHEHVKDCHIRVAAIETRVAVVESNFGNLGRSFDELRREIHEMRAELREMTGRKRLSTGEPIPRGGAARVPVPRDARGTRRA